MNKKSFGNSTCLLFFYRASQNVDNSNWEAQQLDNAAATAAAYQQLQAAGFNLVEQQAQLDLTQERMLLQEEMLRSYLATAESDLKAKQELVEVKQQRLSLAQNDLNHLKSTLSILSESTTSREY